MKIINRGFTTPDEAKQNVKNYNKDSMGMKAKLNDLTHIILAHPEEDKTFLGILNHVNNLIEDASQNGEAELVIENDNKNFIVNYISDDCPFLNFKKYLDDIGSGVRDQYFKMLKLYIQGIGYYVYCDDKPFIESFTISWGEYN